VLDPEPSPWGMEQLARKVDRSHMSDERLRVD